MSRIDKKFKDLRKQNKKAFIAFLTAGYPDLKKTFDLVLELENSGTDIIELGVPFSDPMADGVLIQESSSFALKKGVNLHKILDLVKSIRKKSQIPICLMTYYNPIFCFGKEKFLTKACNSGVDGLIIPDLPPEEDTGFLRQARKNNIDTIFFLSPTTLKERISFIDKRSFGFIYYVSLTGVTGTREELSLDLAKNLRIIKRLTEKPVCVGFGISKPGHLRAIFSLADGAIVGSAIIRKIKQNISRPDMVKRVGRFVRKMTNV
ncbi:MAG: tryptophan synthase subunit alpha [Candidatus Omnitrophica bacterium]|nr:tryptophan synthase subunit alpha [Candidatus Omnitrophota bacterium]